MLVYLLLQYPCFSAANTVWITGEFWKYDLNVQKHASIEYLVIRRKRTLAKIARNVWSPVFDLFYELINWMRKLTLENLNFTRKLKVHFFFFFAAKKWSYPLSARMSSVVPWAVPTGSVFDSEIKDVRKTGCGAGSDRSLSSWRQTRAVLTTMRRSCNRRRKEPFVKLWTKKKVWNFPIFWFKSTQIKMMNLPVTFEFQLWGLIFLLRSLTTFSSFFIAYNLSYNYFFVCFRNQVVDPGQ